MVTCRLVGRLGNQIFQIAAVIGYAKTHSMGWWIPKISMNERIWPTEFKHLANGHQNEIPIKLYYLYKEPFHYYSEIPKCEHIILEGYFQAEQYFSHAIDEVRQAIALPWKPLNDFVGIHVRRGDYLQMQDRHPVVTYDYLRDAILYFIGKKHFSFVVCSDDLPWCKQQLKGLEIYGASFSYSHGHTAKEDLSLLSCCEHLIGSNSSFSLWAHYLNRNEKKRSIFPSTWFGPANAHLSTKDIYPQNSIII